MNKALLAMPLCLAGLLYWGTPSAKMGPLAAGDPPPPLPGAYPTQSCLPTGVCGDEGTGCIQMGEDAAGKLKQPGDAWAPGDKYWCVDTAT
jgi:hypothetical protein